MLGDHLLRRASGETALSGRLMFDGLIVATHVYMKREMKVVFLLGHRVGGCTNIRLI